MQRGFERVVSSASEASCHNDASFQWYLVKCSRIEIISPKSQRLTLQRQRSTHWVTHKTKDAEDKLLVRYWKVNTSDPEVVRALATSGIQLRRRRVEELIRDSQRSAVIFLRHAGTGTALPAAAAGAGRFRDWAHIWARSKRQAVFLPGVGKRHRLSPGVPGKSPAELSNGKLQLQK